MTTLFVWMVLVMVNAAFVSRIANIKKRILAGVISISTFIIYGIYIMPLRDFDFVPDTGLNNFLSITLGALVGGLIAWRINPDYFRWRQTPTTEQQNDPR